MQKYEISFLAFLERYQKYFIASVRDFCDSSADGDAGILCVVQYRGVVESLR